MLQIITIQSLLHHESYTNVKTYAFSGDAIKHYQAIFDSQGLHGHRLLSHLRLLLFMAFGGSVSKGGGFWWILWPKSCVDNLRSNLIDLNCDVCSTTKNWQQDGTLCLWCCACGLFLLYFWQDFGICNIFPSGKLRSPAAAFSMAMPPPGLPLSHGMAIRKDSGPFCSTGHVRRPIFFPWR